MGYEGYLLKMSNPDSQNEEIEIPHKYMQYDSFKTKVNTQDLDSYQDSEGYLHRTVLDHTQIKMEWNFPECDNIFLQELLNIFRSIWGNGPERACRCTTYVPEWNDYYTGIFYMPDPEFNIRSVSNGIVKYKSVRFALIEK